MVTGDYLAPVDMNMDKYTGFISRIYYLIYFFQFIWKSDT